MVKHAFQKNGVRLRYKLCLLVKALKRGDEARRTLQRVDIPGTQVESSWRTDTREKKQPDA
jgi:hypothetical protein